MSKSTPGPWRITGIGESNPSKPFQIKGHRKDVGDGEVVIAEAIPAYEKGSTWQRPIVSGESQANAHLIAAAPELLEACKFALNLQQHSPNTVKEIIKQAIAKAEGGK